jgi:hypothetical protein
MHTVIHGFEIAKNSYATAPTARLAPVHSLPIKGTTLQGCGWPMEVQRYLAFYTCLRMSWQGMLRHGGGNSRRYRLHPLVGFPVGESAEEPLAGGRMDGHAERLFCASCNGYILREVHHAQVLLGVVSGGLEVEQKAWC